MLAYRVFEDSVPVGIIYARSFAEASERAKEQYGSSVTVDLDPSEYSEGREKEDEGPGPRS